MRVLLLCGSSTGGWWYNSKPPVHAEPQIPACRFNIHEFRLIKSSAAWYCFRLYSGLYNHDRLLWWELKMTAECTSVWESLCMRVSSFLMFLTVIFNVLKTWPLQIVMLWISPKKGKPVSQCLCNERVLTSKDKQNCFLSSLVISSSSMSQRRPGSDESVKANSCVSFSPFINKMLFATMNVTVCLCSLCVYFIINTFKQMIQCFLQMYKVFLHFNLIFIHNWLCLKMQYVRTGHLSGVTPNKWGEAHQQSSHWMLLAVAAIS